MKTFYSNGKLLLTGEYLVLDGAKALALPTIYGQTLQVKEEKGKGILWKSYDSNKKLWYEEILYGRLTYENEVSNTLLKILSEAKKLNPSFLLDNTYYVIETHMDFPRDWGLGSSSTLINNIAQWAGVNPYTLLENSFGGSGYDIAAAQAKGAITYQLQNKKPNITSLKLSWDFTESLFFVYLNQKQNSREGISSYKKVSITKKDLDAISRLTEEIIVCSNRSNFQEVLEKHEFYISSLLGIPTVKEKLFKNYSNTIKSLGAWGGDFVLAIGSEKDMDYFKEKGYTTVIPYEKMVL